MADKRAMPDGIVPVGEPPEEYSPEYLEDGRVWLLKNGERLRLLDSYQDFAIAAQMHGGYKRLSVLVVQKEYPVDAPFTWKFGAQPQYDPPAPTPPRYRLVVELDWMLKLTWPRIRVLVALDFAIWRLWAIGGKSRHARFFREFDPVSSYFRGWLDPSITITVERSGEFIALRDFNREIERFKLMLQTTGG